MTTKQSELTQERDGYLIGKVKLYLQYPRSNGLSLLKRHLEKMVLEGCKIILIGARNNLMR